ncbi:hypothetical protein NZK27_03435 [Synechococcus sp. FGCU-3]|nr:hypothetical protein [Synechococcus sp. FGCU3]
MACPHCGSWSVKADRSLAGRLVCGRCGRPLGVKASKCAARSGKPRRLHLPVLGVSWWGWLIALVAVSATLASLQAPPRWALPPSPETPSALPWR